LLKTLPSLEKFMRSMLSAPNVAIGELLWDIIPSGPRLGGTTTNFAVLSARLGDCSALISCVGDDDFGRRAAAHLALLASACVERVPLDLSAIQISSTLPTGTVSVSFESDGQPQYSINHPVAWDAITLPPEALALAARASVICFGTLAQRHQVSRDSIRSFVELASAATVRVCDLNLRKPFCSAEVLRWSLAHSDVLKVSDEELPEVGRLLGEPAIASSFPCSGDLTSAASAAASALLALAPQCKLVAVTLGKHGSLLADRSQTYRHSGFNVDVVDTVGAGDAFTAGLVYAYKRTASMARMSEISNMCGAYVAARPGATPELAPSLLQTIAEVLGDLS
jgi:fructokinase